MKRLITAEIVEAEHASGRTCIAASKRDTVITPAAWARAGELGITFDRDAAPGATAASTPGSCERLVDPSGVVRARGGTARLGKFTGAGADRDIGLLDLVTGRDGSPMTAGIMSWRREESFPWTLDYDEVDLVLEGILQIGIDGRVVEGRPGDVLYIPKGSHIVFGTPTQVRVFYVTYPADWSGAAAAK